MSARPKLSDAQIVFARAVSRKRRELYRQLQMLPTNDEIAANLKCSRRWLERIISERFRKRTPLQKPVVPVNAVIEVIVQKS